MPLKIIKVEFGDEKFGIPRKALACPFPQAIRALKNAIPELEDVYSDAQLKFKVVYMNDGLTVTSAFWKDLIDDADTLYVSKLPPQIMNPESDEEGEELDEEGEAEEENVLENGATTAVSTLRPVVVLSFRAFFGNMDILTTAASTDKTFASIIEPWVQDRGICPHTVQLHYDGLRVLCDLTIEKFMQTVAGDGQVYMFELHLEQAGGKPVIYLYPPTNCQVVCHLDLCPAWEFSALYPQSDLKVLPDGSSSTSWSVFAAPDGTLSDTAGLQYSYLFWEAETCFSRRRLPTPPLDGLSQSKFDPLSAKLLPDNSIKLSRDAVAPYLHSILPSLGLHTEATTSFITYWLPKILKHETLALRFVKQSDYEEAARLTITPTPDVVIRVFMLFKGLSQVEAQKWDEATNCDWAEVVGVDGSLMKDGEKFRVLEWGGMEVLH